MNLILIRKQFLKCGIFGELLDQLEMPLACTLEHSYGPLFDHFAPKVPCGTFLCVRGMHRLDGHKDPFETFEVTGVQSHSGILFHPGNFNKDSHGCILLGETIEKMGGVLAVTHSRRAFERFMELQSGLSEFTLTVRDKDVLTLPAAA